MAVAGRLPGDAAREAEVTAAGWWNAQGDLTPDRLGLLVQELQRRHRMLGQSLRVIAGTTRKAST